MCRINLILQNEVQFKSVVTSLKGLNKLCHYKQMSLLVRCMVKVKEIYFKAKCRPAVTLLNVITMIYFKFKSQNVSITKTTLL